MTVPCPPGYNLSVYLLAVVIHLQVRTARTDAFNAAFEHISAEIDLIYKELTRSGVHPLGEYPGRAGQGRPTCWAECP
jgi:hypothetical protein